MWKNLPSILTNKDFTILETMHDRRHVLTDSVRQLLRHKLDNSTVVFSEDIDDDLVTLNSRVRYRVSGMQPQMAIVTQSRMDAMVGQSLALDTVRGLALLGLRETEEMTLPVQDSCTPQRLVVESVLFQPEAARRQRLNEELARPALRLVHDAGSICDRGRKAANEIKQIR